MGGCRFCLREKREDEIITLEARRASLRSSHNRRRRDEPVATRILARTTRKKNSAPLGARRFERKSKNDLDQEAAALGARLRELRWKNSAWLATAETMAGWNGFEIRNAGSGRSPVRKRSG
jgi:hypothetical protein